MGDLFMPRRPPPDIDILFRVKSLHRPGSLASLFTRLADEGCLIGDIRTVFVGKAHSLRDITISVYDDAQWQRVKEIIASQAGASLVSSEDLVFDKHAGGKVRSVRTRDIKDPTDLRYYYTPGVARVCTAIAADPAKAYLYTNIGNSVAIITNGTRVLGLGDIGPLASLPVMEGKAMIYDQFVGVSATPILVDTKDPAEFVRVVERIACTFGGIHLEDIRVPDCYEVERELQKRLDKPVMHDDQHGTATVCLAAILSALRASGKPDDGTLVVAQIGLGAAGFGIAKLLMDYGLTVLGVDPSQAAQQHFADHGGHVASLGEAMQKADIVVATTGKVGLITPAMVRPGQVILALSNPVPEISPDDAMEAGAVFAADGTSVNNALAYPGLFKAALITRAKAITPGMKIAAARAISELADKGELLPSLFHPSVHRNVIAAVSVAVSVDSVPGALG
jgi:malate dehydrogenase (oxaloacetate-decarboxylating)